MFQPDYDMEEARKVAVCDYCGDDIFEGDKIIRIGTDIFHATCCEEDVARFDDGEDDFQESEREEIAYEQNVAKLISEGCTDEF